MERHPAIYAALRLVACARMLLARPTGVPDDCFLNDSSRYTKVHKTGRPRWKDKKGNLYEWDALHGEAEKYTRQGRHMGALSKDGSPKKPPEKKRRISTR